MSGRDRFEQALNRADEFDRVLGTHMEPTRRILAKNLGGDDRPCVMHAEDDCSEMLPCVECPAAGDTGGAPPDDKKAN